MGVTIERFEGTSDEVTATTDALGDYTIELEAGDYDAWLDAASLPVGEVGPGLVEITIVAAAVTQDWQTLVQAGSITGTVTVDGLAPSGSTLDDKTKD